MAKTGIGVRPENRCHAGLPGRIETKTGDRCRAPKALLTTVEGDIKRYIYCIGHLTKAVGPKKMAERHGFKFGNTTGAGGRPKRPTALEVLRHKVEIEEGIDRVLRPLFDSLDATRAVVVGNGPSARVEVVGDMTEARKASESLLDRVYGKPRQAMELTGAGGGAIQIDVPTDEERAAQVANMLALTGGLHAPVGDLEDEPPVSSNGHRNGHRNGDSS